MKHATTPPARDADGTRADPSNGENAEVLVGRLVYSALFDADLPAAAVRVAQALRRSTDWFDQPQHVRPLIASALARTTPLAPMALGMRSETDVRLYLTALYQELGRN
jgi:ABC-type nitrate/sulfonate/bicarbonate transport system substrate-binding protein